MSGEASADIVIVGCGAAGLMAAIWAGRTDPGRRIVALDGARTLGAKILVAGGGRCNVTHCEVSERDFNGSTPGAIRSVLARFGVEPTIESFREIGVELKLESETGKLFPTTDSARTVLRALLDEARRVGVDIRFPRRVGSVEREDDGLVVRGEWGSLGARRVVLATGGRALPKSGSDGSGYDLARALGHTTTRHVYPALVPLVLERGHPLCELSGVSAPVALSVHASSGRRLAGTAGSLLCTHFGLSGPAVLDISRHLIAARFDDPGAGLVIDWAPALGEAELDARLQGLGTRTAGALVKELLPARLGETVCELGGVQPGTRGASLTKVERRGLVGALKRMAVPVTGDRGFTHAEATAGGVPLAEVELKTMRSRVCPGLFLCGEVLDVDGRIGGFNFQWAWASGHLAGCGAAGQ